MTKVLYIGHYRDGTGWGDAALNNILALDKAGVKVVARAISYNEAKADVPSRITELEDRSEIDCDVCIQHTLPHNYHYSASMKNIGYVAVEGSSFTDSGWHKHINTMDEIWVPSDFVKNACFRSGVEIPIKLAPHSLDMSKYKGPFNGAKIDNLLHTFNFVFVGEFIERKNIKALLRAFHTEFHPTEPVNLFIKTSGAPLQEIQEYCVSIQRGLKLRQNYKEEIIVSGRLEHKDYLSVFDQCHCFVMPSRSEGFCIPALEALALGIPVVYTNGLPIGDFGENYIGWSVESTKEPCFGGMGSLPYLYTANSEWEEINVLQLQQLMRGIYMTGKGVRDEMKPACLSTAHNFSHEAVGQKLKELLNDN